MPNLAWTMGSKRIQVAYTHACFDDDRFQHNPRTAGFGLIGRFSSGSWLPRRAIRW